MTQKRLVDVSHVSKRGSSIRITLPKKIVERLSVESGNIVGFYEEDGGIVVEKID